MSPPVTPSFVPSSPLSITGLLEEQSPLVTVRVREGGSAVLECQPRQRRDISEQHRQGSAKQHRGDVTTTVVEWVSRNHVLPVFLKLGIHPPRIDAAYLGRCSSRLKTTGAEEEWIVSVQTERLQPVYRYPPESED